ncbi:MAG: UDP-N-acetylmuramoylalanyl-D-glutamyl-2,6-diaminopimelate--D-alanyl-D-alanine ligase [Alphaproteobacteria bacterium]|nr:UDP-N-acetylmuramoylalanyl-D-glutamyl-2,6-diaminopimelate--D-alanyl-D-alanine ligase [Alphaproteobacteria bacterium]
MSAAARAEIPAHGLWSGEAVAEITAGAGATGWTARGVSIDTRTLAPGDLFVAIKGERLDGHDFVAEAVRRGAAACLVERLPAEAGSAARCLRVRDVQAALQALARGARARTGARVVAVTGSVGKTGTKEALRLVLARQGATHASAGNLNNQIGCPLSLARMPPGSRYAVMELGMNHAGEIEPLSRMVRPHVAVVTTIAPVHIEFLGTIEAIADAKAEIFAGLEPGGAAVLNRDSAQFDRLAARAREAGVARVIAFGSGAGAEARLLSCELGPDSSQVAAEILGRRVAYAVGQAGRHVAENSLAVLAAASLLGADIDRAAAALSDLAPVEGRGTRARIAVAGGEALMIDESYNASPPAVAAAIAVLARLQPGPGGRRVAVLGDMRELGEIARAAHAGLAEPLVAHAIDVVHTVGPHMEALRAAIPAALRGLHAATSAELAGHIRDLINPGDVVLVKGSLGTRMSAVVAALAGQPAAAH